jgi:hypothetical protein
MPEVKTPAEAPTLIPKGSRRSMTDMTGMIVPLSGGAGFCDAGRICRTECPYRQ